MLSHYGLSKETNHMRHMNERDFLSLVLALLLIAAYLHKVLFKLYHITKNAHIILPVITEIISSD